MKFNISKEWLLKRAHLEEGLEIGAGGPIESLTSSRMIDWSWFPIKEMYKRNWFEGYTGSLSAATAEAEALVTSFMECAIRKPLVALQRQRVRTGSKANPYALLAWQCRVLLIAKSSLPRAPFKHSNLNEEWLYSLVQLSRFKEGPLRAKEHLSNAGIAMVVEPHLTSTHLDGAALLGDDCPVVGLTLRNDRVDNFWFVLLHEIIHIKKHLKKGGVEDIFDECIAEGTDVALSEIEREADELAGQALIPDQSWNSCLARFVRSKESVVSFATKLGISPAIVAGRIRYEAGNWTLLRDLVGQGEVRKLFPKVTFGE